MSIEITISGSRENIDKAKAILQEHEELQVPPNGEYAGGPLVLRFSTSEHEHSADPQDDGSLLYDIVKY